MHALPTLSTPSPTPLEIAGSDRSGWVSLILHGVDAVILVVVFPLALAGVLDA
ncbi:MAG TPA: hypothetical protein VIJ15_13630 [Dermatophilaceae bacterium]